MKEKTVLIVEDDGFVRDHICEMLRDRGLATLEANNEEEALELIESHGGNVHVAVIDIRVPSKRAKHDSDTSVGRRAGLRIARAVRKAHPHIRLIGMSSFAEEEVRDWFYEYGAGYLRKSWLFEGAATQFIDAIEDAARKRTGKKKPRTFIVHGHSTELLFALVGFIQRNLRWPAPTILRELPSHGRTIIEKFEDTAKAIDIAFVLLTPDDKAASAGATDELKRRARQNVIFELGYFYAKLQRTGGRVILLHAGVVELPSDISGIVYVDVSDGIEAAGEALRRELSDWVK
jgi:CheY-like chemotaxis protein